MGKTLIAYFSASGTTARVAGAIAEATGGDLYEIVPAERYTAADLDWNDPASRSSMECRDEAARPAIKGTVVDMDGYDTVFVGFPIWWYVEPRIVDTFLDGYDFAGKTMIPFATSGGSGIARAEEHLAGVCPAATWRAGKLLNGGSVAAWAKKVAS